MQDPFISREDFFRFRGEVLTAIGDMRNEVQGWHATSDATINEVRTKTAVLEERLNNLKDSPARLVAGISAVVGLIGIVLQILSHK